MGKGQYLVRRFDLGSWVVLVPCFSVYKTGSRERVGRVELKMQQDEYGSNARTSPHL